MKRQWTTEELEANFTLHPNELDLIGDSKTDHNLLGAACLFYPEYVRECASFPFREKSPLQWQNELTMPEEQKISLRSVCLPT